MKAKTNLTMLCDFYELTMANGYFQTALQNRICYFDVFYRSVPDKGGFAIAAGLAQVIEYIQELCFDEEDVDYLRTKGCFSEEFLRFLKEFQFAGDIWPGPKGRTPRRPIGLSAVPPTSAGGADEKILGVTAGMEYASQADFSDAKACTGSEAANLSPGTYEGVQTTYVIEVTAAEQPDPSHTHGWSTVWYNNSNHHWRECRTEGCPIAGNSEKAGYGAHTAGSWIIDQWATSSQTGSRHRECTICGYVMVQETTPATGGSSSGGSSSGGSSSGNVTTSTQKNPDGSTTTTKKNQATGAVTTTTKWPDGSQTVVETAKDGTVTTTEKATDGSTVETVQNPDGSSKIIVNRADKVTAETRIDHRGKAVAQVKVPAQVTQQAQRGDKAILLPVAQMPVTSGGLISVTVQTSSKQPVKVELPCSSPGPAR